MPSSAFAEQSDRVDAGTGPGGGARRSSNVAWKIASVVAALVLLAVIAFAVASAAKSPAARLPPASPAALSAGTVAPAFTLPLLGGGGPLRLAAYLGNPVIVNFFASWCPHCAPELPALAALAARSGQRVAVMGVDSDDPNPSAALSMLAAAHATYPVVVDPKAQVSTQYLLTALPATYFIGRDGRVVGAAFGAQTGSQLSAWLRRLTATPTHP